jgi:hypothetical protein
MIAMAYHHDISNTVAESEGSTLLLTNPATGHYTQPFHPHNVRPQHSSECYPVSSSVLNQRSCLVKIEYPSLFSYPTARTCQVH